MLFFNPITSPIIPIPPHRPTKTQGSIEGFGGDGIIPLNIDFRGFLRSGLVCVFCGLWFVRPLKTPGKTVDGSEIRRSPPEIVLKTLQIMVDSPYQVVSRISSINSMYTLKVQFLPKNSCLVGIGMIHGLFGFPILYQWGSRFVDLDFLGMTIYMYIYTMRTHNLHFEGYNPYTWFWGPGGFYIYINYLNPKVMCLWIQESIYDCGQ